MKSLNPPGPPLNSINICEDTKEARCDCGHLVAKLRKEGVELKCKRCKRIVLLPLDSD